MKDHGPVIAFFAAILILLGLIAGCEPQSRGQRIREALEESKRAFICQKTDRGWVVRIYLKNADGGPQLGTVIPGDPGLYHEIDTILFLELHPRPTERGRILYNRYGVDSTGRILGFHVTVSEAIAIARTIDPLPTD